MISVIKEFSTRVNYRSIITKFLSEFLFQFIFIFAIEIIFFANFYISQLYSNPLSGNIVLIQEVFKEFSRVELSKVVTRLNIPLQTTNKNNELYKKLQRIR